MPFMPDSGSGWSDVFSHRDGWGITFQRNGWLVEHKVFPSNPRETLVAVPEMGIMETRAVEGFAVVKGNPSGRAYLISFYENNVIDLPGLCFGVQSVGIFASGREGCVVYVVTSPTQHYSIFYSPPTGLMNKSDSLHAPTTQGILDVLDTGTILWADMHHVTRIGGVVGLDPNVRGNVLVAKRAEDPFQLIAGTVDLVSTIREGLSFEPHLAGLGNGTLVFNARTPEGAFFFFKGPEDPWPPYVPVPQPDPEPEPDPEPMPFQQRMPNMKDVVQQVAAAFPELLKASGSDARFIKIVAARLHAIDSRFGLLGKRMTDDLAFDSITFRNETVDPQLPLEMSNEAADVVAGSHTSDPQPTWAPSTVPVREGGFGAKWIQPEADPDPDPEPEPDSAIPQLKADMVILQSQMFALVEVVKSVNDRMADLTGIINNLGVELVVPPIPGRTGSSKVNVFKTDHSHDLTAVVECLQGLRVKMLK